MEKKIKILWFCNTPSLAEEKFSASYSGGGWIKSLEEEIKKKQEIDLSLAFYHNEDIQPFKYNNTNYYPIYFRKNNIFTRYYNRFKAIIERKGELEKFLEIIKIADPDIIHVHGTEEAFGIIRQHTKVPVVISIQGNINVYKQKFFAGISKTDARKYNSPFHKLKMKSILYHYKIFGKMAMRESAILNSCQYLIGRTEWDRKISLVLSPGSKYFHNDEILRKPFYNFEWKNTLSKPINLFTTSGTAIYKGIETIIQTAQLLDNIGFDYKWNIAGLNKNDELLKIVQKTLKTEISENIYFLDKLDENELINNLLNSHCYIMPSHIENSPNNLCEALIIGLPCIASNAGGTSSLLEHNLEGTIVQDGDPYVLAGSIIELSQNYENAINMAKKARLRALKRHDKNKIVTELLSIYRSILDN